MSREKTFGDIIKVDWASPCYVIRMPLKDNLMLQIRIPDEFDQDGEPALTPYIKIINLRNSDDVTEKFLKKAEADVSIYPSARNIWTLIDVIHTTLRLQEA